ncbi:MAG: ABC transporter permease [Bacteroidales bacterium]|nr:ABC transporter permease [Bacteroidales bacterium]
MGRVFTKPDDAKVFRENVWKEIILIGYYSIVIVLIISTFIGAVITLQTAYNMTNPIYPDYIIGLGTRDSVILEFSSTIVGLVLAGKVGSSIASNIGTMQVTQQIDALETMGVNSANFLILPKIVAAVITFPFLGILSMITGIAGGWLAGMMSGEVPSAQYVYGLQYAFIPYYIVYSLIKICTFGIIISSVASYYGYYTRGGALEVGKASTTAVVNSSLIILVFNLLLTALLL